MERARSSMGAKMVDVMFSFMLMAHFNSRLLMKLVSKYIVCSWRVEFSHSGQTTAAHSQTGESDDVAHRTGFHHFIRSSDALPFK